MNSSNINEQQLPEGNTPAPPPRPLVAGAFLAGEYEIKELISRGIVNYYHATGGDYSQPVDYFIAEHIKSTPQHDIPPETTEIGSQTETLAPSPMDEARSAIMAALGAEQATTIEDEVTQEEVEPNASEEALPLNAPLFATGAHFVHGDREYIAFEYETTTPLQDWREPTNDVRYLRVIITLLQGFEQLERNGLTAHFTPETLRFTQEGELRFFGFTSQPHDKDVPALIVQLSAINSFLLKHVFAESSTMRLDDEWSALALCEETRDFAMRLSDHDSQSIVSLVRSLPHLPLVNPRTETAMFTDTGQEREINEDSGLVACLNRAGHRQTLNVELLAVADGMGGHEGGEVASDLTLNALNDAVTARADMNWNDNIAVRGALWQIIDEVNTAVVELTQEPHYRSMRNKPGATLVFALRVGATIYIGNVGDSRAYLWNSTQGLRRVTKDHSYVQTLIDSGQLAPEDAWGHPDGSIITAHIGMTKLKQRDVFMRLALPGDKLILVSDGVVDMLKDEEIEPHLHHDSPEEICHSLIQASNIAGGFDNITVAAMKIF